MKDVQIQIHSIEFAWTPKFVQATGQHGGVTLVTEVDRV